MVKKLLGILLALAMVLTVAAVTVFAEDESDVAVESYVLGDVDADGYVTSTDARMTLRKSAGLATLSDAEFAAADVNGDGDINAYDARTILRASALLDDELGAPAREYLDADRSDDVYLGMYYDSAVVGSELEVVVYAENMLDMKNANLFFGYDADYLEFVSVAPADSASYDMGVGNNLEDGYASWAFVYTQSALDDSDLVVLTFNVLEAGYSEIYCTVGTWEGTEVPYDTGIGIYAYEEHVHDYTYSVVVTPASCYSDGYTTYTCSCGDSYTADWVYSGHSYTTTVTEPTCTSSGYTTYSCSACGYSYTTDYTYSNGHTYVDSLYCTSCDNCAFSYSLDKDGNAIITYCYWNVSGKISIPDKIDGHTVVSIGEYAFDWCESITSVTIPATVKTIAYEAFYGCTALESVSIGGGVTDIYDYAFANCTSLTSVTLPASVTSLGDGVFRGCTSLEKIIVNANNTAYSSDSNGILYNKDKTEILACPPATALTSVTIPATVTKIGDSAFYACSAVTEIVIPDTVTEIGNRAFYNCNKLLKLEIPAGVTEIGEYAFSECDKITTLVIPEGVTKLSDGLFYGCERLTFLTLPTAYTEIGDSTFGYCEGLTSIEIPETVTEIGSYAFGSCTYLSSITLPSGITEIKDSTFYRCHALTSIDIPEGVTSIGYDAFYYCKKLLSVTIPSTVTEIGAYAFEDCYNLDAIVIPEGVTDIGAGAFRDCTSLESITLPSTLIHVGSDIIYNTAYSNDASNWTDGVLYMGTFLLDVNKEELPTDYTIKDGTTVISNSAFYYAYNLESITIPKGLKTIGDYAFEECDALKKATIYYGVTEIGNYAFAYCYDLKSIGIPSSVTTIGYNAFYDCYSIESITIPASVTEIGSYAFAYCDSLTSITLPDSNPVIGTHAFYSCGYYDDYDNWQDNMLYIGNYLIKTNYRGSGKLTVKDGTIQIAGGAFEDCYAEEIVLPESVTIIGDSAFSWCYELEKVNIPSAVTYIGDEAFYYCEELLTLTIPETVTYLGEYAFYGCEDLMTANIPASITEIPDGLFSRCKSLTSITLPEGTTIIGDYAFYRCSSLESISIPETVTEIGSYAFAGCEKIKEVTVPEGVLSIGDCAFGYIYEEEVDEYGYVINSKMVVDEEFVLTGIIGTAAETYAAENDITFNGVLGANPELGLNEGSTIVINAEALQVTIADNSTVTAVLEQISNETVKIYGADGVELAADALVGTGAVIKIMYGEEVLSEYTVLVLCDIDGNGKATAADARLALRNSAKLDTLEGVYLAAADVDANEKVTAADARYILRKSAKLEG